MDPLPVAIDVGPLHGHRTGIGRAVDALVGALEARDDVHLVPYLVSARARPEPPQRRLPIPARAAIALWSRVDRPRADRWLDGARLVHGTNYVVPPARVPGLVSVYDCWFLRNPRDASPSVRRAGAVLRRAVARGVHVHVSSAATAEEVRALLGTDRVHVVHLGRPATLHDDGGSLPDGLHGRPMIVTVGTVERRKDVPALVAAFGLVARRDADVQLVIAGAPGDDQQRVDAALRALPATTRDRVHVLGPIDDAAKGRLLARASVFASTAVDEGFGFPLLEAQSACLPVVARRAGSVAEIGGDGVALVDGSGAFVDAFADELVTAISDGTRRLDLVEAGMRNVARFDWARTAAAMAALYHRVADEGR